jgi:hypothetical protein
VRSAHTVGTTARRMHYGGVVADQERPSSGPEDGPLPPLGSASSTRQAERTTYERRQPPELTPWTLIIFGAIISVVAGYAASASSGFFAFLGVALVGLGSVITAIGTIAEGIRLGARWVKFERGE